MSRLERLVQSGMLPVETAEKHVEELKAVVNKIAGDEASRREARLFKALADPTRVKILKLLSTRDMCVCEIMVALGLTQPTASHHLGMLERAGLVGYRRGGKWIFYGVQDKRVIELIKALGKTVKA